MKFFRHHWRGFGQDIWANGIVSFPLIPIALRRTLLQWSGFEVGRARIQSGVRWFGSGEVTIEDGVFINRYCTFNHSGHVSILRNSAIGPECLFITASHEIGLPGQRSGQGFVAPIVVGAGAWIGARVIVLPGVTIGAGAVIASGSVVNRDVPANEMWAGVPAVWKGALPEH